MILCVQCNSVAVEVEFTRCHDCNQKHQELVAKLDARPKPAKAVKQGLIPIVTKKKVTYPDGEIREINFTTWYERAELILWNIPIPDEYK